MTLLSAKDKLKNEQLEREEAWKLLRNIPEYKEDYELTVKLRAKKSKSNSLKIKAIEKKWGVGILGNPEEERPNFEFLNHFSDFEFLNHFSDYNPEVSRHNSAVDFGGLDDFYRKDGVFYDPNDNVCSELESPSEVTVKIDIDAPIGVIIKELKSGLENIKALFNIPKKNTSSHDHLTFLVGILQKIELNESEIIDRLTPEHVRSLPYEHEARQSVRKQISRRIKKT